jgi:hypothetical protein
MEPPQPDSLAEDIKALLQERSNYSFTTADIADALRRERRRRRELGWELGAEPRRSFWAIVNAACRRLWRAGEIHRARYDNPDQNSKQSRRNDFRWVYLSLKPPPPEVEEMHREVGYDA